jgi:hypothetical protein
LRCVPERYIDWEDVDPLDSTTEHPGRVSRTRLAELHPSTADITDQLTPRDRLASARR